MRIDTDTTKVDYPQVQDLTHISPRPEKPGSGDEKVQGNGQKKVLTEKEIVESDIGFLKEKTLKAQNIQDVVEKLNETMKAFDIQLRFEVYKPTKDIMVKIYDARDNKVIKEIPPKKVLEMVAKMLEMVGLLVDEKI